MNITIGVVFMVGFVSLLLWDWIKNWQIGQGKNLYTLYKYYLVYVSILVSKITSLALEICKDFDGNCNDSSDTVWGVIK